MSTISVNIQIADVLEQRGRALAEATVAHCWTADPDLEERYGDRGRQKCVQDVGFHIMYLANAIAMACPSLFADYLGWAKALLTGLGIPAGDVANSLEALRIVTRRELPHDMSDVISRYVDVGLTALGSDQQVPSCLVDSADPLSDLARQYVSLLLKGDRRTASEIILDSAGAGISVRDLYLHVFQPAQYETGRLWQTNQITVAQEHLLTASTQLIMSQLYPLVFSSKKNGRSVVAACVGGDLHELGCRMVADFFEMEGWSTFFLGANTPTSSVVKAALDYKAEILVISATMSFHLRAVGQLVAAVRAANPQRSITVMVGGYPFNLVPSLWQAVDADVYARDAQEAVALSAP
jgi:methanogenic corrinoid protein MtbC1